MQKCLSKVIDMKRKQKIVYCLIQTDKPIYEPEDEVKLRVLMVDKDLKS